MDSPGIYLLQLTNHYLIGFLFLFFLYPLRDPTHQSTGMNQVHVTGPSEIFSPKRLSITLEVISIALSLARRLILYLIYISFNQILIEKCLTLRKLRDIQLCHLLSFSSLIVATSKFSKLHMHCIIRLKKKKKVFFPLHYKSISCLQPCIDALLNRFVRRGGGSDLMLA